MSEKSSVEHVMLHRHRSGGSCSSRAGEVVVVSSIPEEKQHIAHMKSSRTHDISWSVKVAPNL